MKTKISKISKIFIAYISVFTSLGIFMHDSRLDKMTLVAIDHPHYAKEAHINKSTHQKAKVFLETESHVHSDHSVISHLLHSNIFRTTNSIPPRRDHQNSTIMNFDDDTDTGRHAFDDVNLPILS